jgi:hypothetical protein
MYFTCASLLKGYYYGKRTYNKRPPPLPSCRRKKCYYFCHVDFTEIRKFFPSLGEWTLFHMKKTDSHYFLNNFLRWWTAPMWEMGMRDLFLQNLFIYYYWKFKKLLIFHEIPVVRKISANGFRCKSNGGFRSKMRYY